MTAGAAAASLAWSVGVWIEEHAGLARSAEPIRLGVPLARGRLHDPSEVVLLDGNERALAHQVRALAYWPDRSIKWLLLDAAVSVAAHARVMLALGALRTTAAGGGAAPPAVEIEERAGSWRIRTGAALFELGRTPGSLLAAVSRAGVDLLTGPGAQLALRGCTGREYRAIVEHSSVEDGGPLRATLVSEGHFESVGPEAPIAFRARCSFFAGSPLLQIELLVHNPRRACHHGGLWDLDDRGTVLFEDLSLSLVPARGARALHWYAEQPEAVRSDAPEDWQLYQDSSGGENWDSDNHLDGAGRSTVSFRGYRVSCRAGTGPMLIAEGDRATPCLRVATDAGTIATTTLAFWQNFPKALRFRDGCLSIGLFPEECRAPFALQGGEQKRQTMLLEFLLPDEPSAIPARQRPLRVGLDPEAVERSGAVEGFVPAASDPNESYMRYVDSMIEGPHALVGKRELIDEYGWRHFGDLYADHEGVNHPGPRALVSHYNNQYDFILGALVQYLRSADARWWQLAQEAAVHTIDIDLYHTDADRAAFNHGMFWHTDHHMPAATGTHRTYSRRNSNSRRYGGGPSNEHNYSSGLLLYFHLSGDPEAARAVRELADWVIAMDDGARSVLAAIDPSPTGLASQTVHPNYHQAGRGAGNSINALIDAHALGGEQCYLEKAEELIRRCIHPADDIAALRLSEPELRWSYLVFLQALGKYLHLKLEWNQTDYMFHYGRASLLHYARWMAAHEVPYQEVLNRVALPTETWPAQDMRKCHVLHLAAEFAPPDECAALHARAAFFFERSLTDVLSFDTAFLTRPRVILCVCGYPHAYFQQHPDRSVQREDPGHEFGQPERFTPQRRRWRTALPAKLHLLARLLARVSIERLDLFGRRTSPSRI